MVDKRISLACSSITITVRARKVTRTFVAANIQAVFGLFLICQKERNSMEGASKKSNRTLFALGLGYLVDQGEAQSWGY